MWEEAKVGDDGDFEPDFEEEGGSSEEEEWEREVLQPSKKGKKGKKGKVPGSPSKTPRMSAMAIVVKWLLVSFGIGKKKGRPALVPEPANGRAYAVVDGTILRRLKGGKWFDHFARTSTTLPRTKPNSRIQTLPVAKVREGW
jgi:hypothetical protein